MDTVWPSHLVISWVRCRLLICWLVAAESTSAVKAAATLVRQTCFARRGTAEAATAVCLDAMKGALACTYRAARDHRTDRARRCRTRGRDRAHSPGLASDSVEVKAWRRRRCLRAALSRRRADCSIRVCCGCVDDPVRFSWIHGGRHHAGGDDRGGRLAGACGRRGDRNSVDHPVSASRQPGPGHRRHRTADRAARVGGTYSSDRDTRSRGVDSIAVHLARVGHDARLWARDAALAEEMFGAGRTRSTYQM